LTGRWGREWIAWRDFPQWAGQLARSARRSPVEHRLQAEFRQQGDEVAAVVDLLNQDGGFADRLTLKGNLTAAGRPTSVASFQQIAPGRYEARLSAGQSGAYLLTLHEEKKGAAPSVLATVPFVVPYPREYRELTPNLALLSRIAEETGGELLRPDQPEQGVKRLFTPDPAKATAARALWQPLAGLGLLLFLADLAARRWPRRTVRSRESFAETVSIA
jgi:hypothetical protein